MLISTALSARRQSPTASLSTSAEYVRTKSEMSWKVQISEDMLINVNYSRGTNDGGVGEARIEVAITSVCIMKQSGKLS